MDKEKLRLIKSSFRRAMNADIQDVMRAHGVLYKLNFGVPAPQIKGIAAQFEPNQEDATYLWHEDVRESKILATYLYPVSEFSFDIAKEWIKDIRYTEIADQLCMNLLIHITFGEQLLDYLLQQSDPISHYVAYRYMNRMLQKQPNTIFECYLETVKEDLLSSVSYLYQAAHQLIARIAEEEPKLIEELLQEWNLSQEDRKKNLYQMICYWID